MENSIIVTWRFFVGEDKRWRWQQQLADRTVVAESRTSYASYEHCIAAAQVKGYVYMPAQDKLARLDRRVHFKR